MTKPPNPSYRTLLVRNKVSFQWGINSDPRAKKWGAHLFRDAVWDRERPFSWSLNVGGESTEFRARHQAVGTDFLAKLVQTQMARFAIPAIISDEAVPNQVSQLE